MGFLVGLNTEHNDRNDSNPVKYIVIEGVESDVIATEASFALWFLGGGKYHL